MSYHDNLEALQLSEEAFQQAAILSGKDNSLPSPPKRPERLAFKIVSDAKRHLVTIPYSLENLHAAAQYLGIKKVWFHGNHYDIPVRRIFEIGKRVDKQVTQRQILQIIKGQITEFNQLYE